MRVVTYLCSDLIECKSPRHLGESPSRTTIINEKFHRGGGTVVEVGAVVPANSDYPRYYVGDLDAVFPAAYCPPTAWLIAYSFPKNTNKKNNSKPAKGSKPCNRNTSEPLLCSEKLSIQLICLCLHIII
jgi:hypothetical protein